MVFETENRSQLSGAPNQMANTTLTTPTASVSPSTTPRAWWRRIAGLILGPATSGLSQLLQQLLDLGNAPGRANTGDKVMTLVASALAGGDCIDDADVLRTGGTARTLGGTVKAPSTLGTFPTQLPLGPRPPTGPGELRVAGTRLEAAGAGPGDCAPDHRPGFDHLRDLWTESIAKFYCRLDCEFWGLFVSWFVIPCFQRCWLRRVSSASSSCNRASAALARALSSSARAFWSSKVGMGLPVAGSCQRSSPRSQRTKRSSAALYPCRTPSSTSSMATGS